MPEKLPLKELKIFVNIQAISLLIVTATIFFHASLWLGHQTFWILMVLSIVTIASVLLQLFRCANQRRQWIQQACLYTCLTILIILFIFWNV